MPARTIARTASGKSLAASSFTMSAPPSFTRRMAARTALSVPSCSGPNGKSQLTSARATPRRTALQTTSISSIVTSSGLVCPHKFTPTESPTDTMSTPARSATRAIRYSQATTPTLFFPSRFIWASSISVTLSPMNLLPLEVVEGCANLPGVKHLAGFKTVVKLEHVMTKISTLVVRIACLVSACGVLSWNAVFSGAESDPITIGAVLPLTGEAAHWGIPAGTGAELAVHEINAAGGIRGRSLALVVEDDRCNPAEGVLAFNAIMASAKPPVAVLGAVCSAVTLALAPLVQSRKVVLISPASTSPKLTGAGDFIFRVVTSR